MFPTQPRSQAQGASSEAPTYTSKQENSRSHSPRRAGEADMGTGLSREEELWQDTSKSYSKIIQNKAAVLDAEGKAAAQRSAQGMGDTDRHNIHPLCLWAG